LLNFSIHQPDRRWLRARHPVCNPLIREQFQPVNRSIPAGPLEPHNPFYEKGRSFFLTFVAGITGSVSDVLLSSAVSKPIPGENFIFSIVFGIPIGPAWVGIAWRESELPALKKLLFG